jgi:DNA-binding transcriptional MerR regulator
MKTGTLATWLNVSVSTIKKWSVEFGEYLSSGAQGSTDSRRVFDERDARIIYTIARLRDENKSYDDIREFLRYLELGEWADLPQLPERPPGTGPVPMIPQAEAEAEITHQRRLLLREIALLSDRIDGLEGEVRAERRAHEATREELAAARERLGELRGKLEFLEADQEVFRTMQVTLTERTAQVSQHRARLEALEGQRRLWLYTLVAVAIVAAVLLAVVVLLALGGPVG